MKVLKFNEFENIDRSEEYFLEIIENMINPLNEEFDKKDIIKKVLKKLSNDLKFNIGLVGTFGTGIGFMIPIVQRLIENSNLSVELTEENLILLCITIISITYLEETKNKTGEEKTPQGDDSLVTKKDAQTMLAELKMRGIGNGIVKKLVEVFKSIGKFFHVILRSTPYVIDGLIDMFAYTALLMPSMNAILAFVNKYDMNIDNIISNLLSVGVAGGALIARQGVNWLVNKLKNVLKLKDVEVPDPDDNKIISPYDMIDLETETEEDTKLIKEQ